MDACYVATSQAREVARVQLGVSAFRRKSARWLVPRYHFNVHDGFTRPDPKGTELPDRKAVRAEAIRVAGRILEEDADRVSLGEVWYMEVTNCRGVVVFQLDFRVSESGTGVEPKYRKASGQPFHSEALVKAAAF